MVGESLPSSQESVAGGATSAALTLLPALIPAAAGKAPIAGSQVISIHRMKLGEFEVTTMLDGYLDIPPVLLQGDPELVKRDVADGLITAHAARDIYGVEVK